MLSRVVLSSLVLTGLVVACLAVVCVPALAEDTPEALRPPKGAAMAIVVFEDLQCPRCGMSRRCWRRPRGPIRFRWCSTISAADA